MNSLGDRVVFTSFGESHGVAIGGVVEGIKAGLPVSMPLIREQLQRRAGKEATNNIGVSTRALTEKDEVEWLSGIIEKDGQWLTTGTPIAFIIRNTNAKPEDYEWMKHNYRPGHADFTYQAKYGIRDYRGGGRASARETTSRVVAGTLVRQSLQEKGIHISASLVQVGETTDPKQFDTLLREVQTAGDSIGGVVECKVDGLPVGVGEPLFDKLQARLAYAMMSINGCKGFEYGTGFSDMHKRGSELYIQGEVPCAASGGIEGGISNGLTLTFRCAFKPAATIRSLYKGRHDSCIAIRAVPVVEAMTALVLADYGIAD